MSWGEYSGGRVEDDALPQWKLPPWPWIKINVDAVVRPEFAVGIGFARNDQGEVVATRAEQCDCPYSLVAEARAILMAAKLGIDKGWDLIIVESDC